MFKLQKKAARVITGDPYDNRSNEVFQKLNWLPMNIHLQIREHISVVITPIWRPKDADK